MLCRIHKRTFRILLENSTSGFTSITGRGVKMDYRWIKPMRNPPEPETTFGISSAARRVLAVLQARFQRNCSFGVPSIPRGVPDGLQTSTFGATQDYVRSHLQLKTPTEDTFIDRLPTIQLRDPCPSQNGCFPRQAEAAEAAPGPHVFIPDAFSQDAPVASFDALPELDGMPWSSTPRSSPSASASFSLANLSRTVGAEESLQELFPDTFDADSLEAERRSLGSPISLYDEISPITSMNDEMLDASPGNSMCFNYHGISESRTVGSRDIGECIAPYWSTTEKSLCSELNSCPEPHVTFISNNSPQRSNDFDRSLLFSNSSGEADTLLRGEMQDSVMEELPLSGGLVASNQNKVIHETKVIGAFDSKNIKSTQILNQVDAISTADGISTNEADLQREADISSINFIAAKEKDLNLDDTQCLGEFAESGNVSLDIFGSPDKNSNSPKYATSERAPIHDSRRIKSPKATKFKAPLVRKYLGNAFKRSFESASMLSPEHGIMNRIHCNKRKHEGTHGADLSPNKYPQKDTSCTFLSAYSSSCVKADLTFNQSIDDCDAKQNHFQIRNRVTPLSTDHHFLRTDLGNKKKVKLQQSVLFVDDSFKSQGESGISEVSHGKTRKGGTLRFKVPFKDDMDKMKKELKSQLKSIPKSVDKQLSEENALELRAKVARVAPIEVALTIQFKGGFTQLNKPVHSLSLTCQPTTLLMRILWDSGVEFVSINWNSISWSSLILKEILLRGQRNICYGTQEMCQLLVDKFNFTFNEVSQELLFLDPLVGCWLLSPDEPPESFDAVTKILKLNEVFGTSSEELLKKLSRSAEFLYQNLSTHGLWKLFLHIEMRVTPILACMELHGIQVDIAKLQEMEKILERSLLLLQEKAHKLAGKVFQLTSPQQLGTVLYDELKLDAKSNIKVKETVKRQHKSTSESTLMQFKGHHPLPGLVIEFRKLHKLKTTYVNAILEQACGTYIHSTWHQTSGATGRIVSSDPNLQAVPKHPMREYCLPNSSDLSLRSAYIARPGCSFVAADFQHIELRVFAHLSKDLALIDALHRPQDIFKVLAQHWLECKCAEDVTNENRDKTKCIVYALMYGARPSKLAESLQVSYQQACKIFKSFTDTFPSMEKFAKKALDTCSRQGFLATENGRRRWFPNITHKDINVRQHAERQAVNFLIQGSAADICKCAMIQAQKTLAINNIEARLLLQIHDELLWEVDDSQMQAATELVQLAMEEATTILQNFRSFSVPLPVIVKQGKTWADMNMIKRTSFGCSSQAGPS